ncbi:MAG: glycosyltransferase family 4 protein [Anaerolineaceae bacterium]|jgi:glycosyltransferase involved in cell wall biosynthesis|nr:glycosyltransferase family 4 protein [Anaerolineaceae bacterium]
MHILIIHQAFADLNEAGGTRHYEMARFLVQRGHTITIIASPISYITGQAKEKKIAWLTEQHPEPGITVLRSYAYPALHRSFFHRLVNFFSFMLSSFITGLRVKNVDIVWGTCPPIFQGVTAWLVARLKGIPFLFEIRDLWPKFAIAVGVLKNPVLIGLSEWLEQFLYRRADRLIVNSPGYIAHVTERGGKHVTLIPNGADPAMFDTPADSSTILQSLGLQDNYIVLYAGAHGLSNDLGIVLQAAKKLETEPQIHFVLVGGGKDKPALIQQSEEMQLTNLTFLPARSKTEMPALIGASDACLAILKPIEAFKTTYPNKVFDYMAAGRPVILAIDGVVRQVVEKAQAGIFVPPGDPDALAFAIMDMSAHRDRGHKMGAAGRQYVEKHFSRAESAAQLAALLEEMDLNHV